MYTTDHSRDTVVLTERSEVCDSYRGREVLLGFMNSGSRFAVRTPPFAFRRPPPHFVLRTSRFSAQLSIALRTARFALRGSYFAVCTSRFALHGSRPNIICVTGGLTLAVHIQSTTCGSYAHAQKGVVGKVVN